MTLRFIDGFDHYSTAQILRKWTSINGANPSTNTMFAGGRYGGGNYRVTAGGSYTAWLTKTLPASATWVIGFAFKNSTYVNFSVPVAICSLVDVSTIQCDLRLNVDGTLSVTRAGTALTGGTSTVALLAGVWYYVEWKVTIADSIAANSCKVRVNGVDVINVATAQDTKNTANASANVFYLGCTTTIFSSSSLDFDDLYICDQSGSVNNDFLGDVKVETLYPSGIGTTAQWTPLAGANYTCVDENPATDDTDYVSSGTVAQKDTYAMGNLSGNPVSIFGVQTVLQHRKDDAGSRTAAAVIRSGGADYDGAAASVLDNYACATEIRETDPATSAAWTTTNVNAMEAGVKLVS